jgi:enhancing lycopene biosynthesis protein 2
MNVNMVPQTFVLNGKKEIVKHHSSYTPGSEEKLIEEVTNLLQATHQKAINVAFFCLLNFILPHISFYRMQKTLPVLIGTIFFMEFN